MTTRNKKLLLAFLLMAWALVAIGVWTSMRVPSTTVVGSGVTDSTDAAERVPAVAASMDLRLDLLDRPAAGPDALRDLFSNAPLADPGASQATASAPPVTAEPAIGAQLRYMGFVEMDGGTIALLQEGREMYLAREGDRVGPGYLITVVDQSFVEIEYRGGRRRLPVLAGEHTNGGRP